MDCINDVRVRTWRQQPPEFFRRAVVDVGGTLAPTTGECKRGMDIAYNGAWGYNPLLVSLANTKEPLFLVNRSGNRPSHEGAAAYLDKSFDLLRRAGLKSILARGDTDFSQAGHLDRWDAAGDVTFLFGLDCIDKRVALAQASDEGAWKPLVRPARYQVKTDPPRARRRPQRVKQRVVRERKFINIATVREDVAEFPYRPVACEKEYRVPVLRMKLVISKGDVRLREEYRYFFFITNDRLTPAGQLVLRANRRCDQPQALSGVEGENLIEQMKNGVKAMRMPCGDLVSNGAYMVMAGLAWTLKAGAAPCLPVSHGEWGGRHRERKHALLTMEFKRFGDAFARVPCQLVRTGRRLVSRLLSWSPWAAVLLRAAEAWRAPLPAACLPRCRVVVLDAGVRTPRPPLVFQPCAAHGATMRK